MKNTSQIEHKTILRTLWYQKDEANTHTLSQADLVQRAEPLIILGEAGMGKSYLLEWLATNSAYARCTARQLINRHNPRTLLGDAKILLIDALDEVSTQQGGDAVDQVLRKLGELDYPTFVLSCRVADWRSSTGLAAINEQYVEKPLELHLEPFNDDDAVNFLGFRLGVDTAQTVIEHFNARNLKGLLGNPQTLELIIRVANKGKLPDTRSELFSKAIEVLRVEHKDGKSSYQPAEGAGLDAAGAAFAALILTGSEALVRKGAANQAEGELMLADIATLPAANEIRAVLSTRLFKAEGTDRFSYWHRRIGEFLAARWLAKNANTQRKRRRLLALFHNHGLVPANLRGLHAWLAREPSLSLQVIAADPMGVIEYGDADDLSLEHARALIDALKKLAAENPHFRDWGPYSVRGIVQPELLTEVRELITHPGTQFGLRLLILEAVKGTKVASHLTTELRILVLEDKLNFASRSAAARALVGLASDENWPATVRILKEYNNDLSIRLAMQVIDDVGYTNFDDELIVEVVMTHVQINNHTVGLLMRMQKHLPDSRIEGVLNYLISAATALDGPYTRRGAFDIADFAYHLIVRRVTAGGVSADKLWSWLEPFDSTEGYHRDLRLQLDELIKNDDFLRQGIQRIALLEKNREDSICRKAFYLSRRSQALSPTPKDIINLLKALDPIDQEDERWLEIVKLAPHQSGFDAEILKATHPFTKYRPDLLIPLDRPILDELNKWRDEENKRELQQRAERSAKFEKQRQNFTVQIHRMRLGDSNVLTQPAMAYLNQFDDLDKSLPAEERIEGWLGSELSEAAHRGFEIFLTITPPSPTASEIASLLAENRYWVTACVMVAALAERFRQNIGFDDLTNEHLLAGFFELRRSKIEDDAKIVGLEKMLEITLIKRGVWSAAMQLYYEPQFQARRAYVDELTTFMRNDEHASIANELADDWLARFHNIPNSPELELMTRLLRSGQFEKLRQAKKRFTDTHNEERRRNWESIGVFVDFEKTVARLEKVGVIEPELLWHLKNFIGERTASGDHVSLNPFQLEWIITTFRPLWPQTRPQTGGFVGDKNAWDASDHLTYLIRRLGSDTSGDSSASLMRLRDAPEDGYTTTVQLVAFEQARLRLEIVYVSPTLDAIRAIANDGPPQNATDLRTFMIEELSIIQSKIKSDDAESWRGFYKGNVANGEEVCRDHLLGLLRQGSQDIVYEPEAHVSANKEVDITCSVGRVRIPIEIKGQWHPQLWQGADAQLDTLYTRDWRADGCGIYLALWFGEGQPANKSLKNPGQSRERPQSPEELRQMLTASSRAASEGRVIVFVLDLTHP
ncbi:NACHT domain-containing protein [Janthinobacterium rivuli]|uniref:NACHT domain-containing protein n=1 Tax=Janthinobacterium rivuli TaxID=2751478 RepID=UPI00383B6882